MNVQTPIISTHRGRQVVLGRKHVSPHVLGPRRAMAMAMLDSLPAPPLSRDWIAAAASQCGGNFGMFLNNRLGCCTLADGPAHDTQIWTANNGAIVTVPDSVVLSAYETVDGYNPADPSTDQGGVETDVLGAWQKGIAGFARLDGWIPVSITNQDHVRKAIDRYGCLYIGVALPLSAQDEAVWQLDMTDPANAAPGSWGNHAISLSKYDEDGCACVTWAMEQGMTWDWLAAYADEAYAPVCTPLWAPSGTAPNGYSAKDLIADLGAVA